MQNDIQGQLVLAQNQHALIQDTTKGIVQVYSGPHTVSLSPNDKPVLYNASEDIFEIVSVAQAVRQNPRAPEGHYLVLENPAFDMEGKLRSPDKSANAPVDLQTGRKINIPGPATFPLWPGQTAKPVPGHHMRSNQYLVVRIYNAEEANKNCPAFLRQEEVFGFNNGQLLVIKGTEIPFFIPPTGFEVLTDNGGYVREALTLEQLEYCILLDEDGNKRYAHGPQVVFPEATETFITKQQDDDENHPSRKFKMIELNDQMGLYIKVIADYEEEVAPGAKLPEDVVTEARDGKTFAQYKTGQELFITGKEQRIYCPRAEHALISYADSSNGKRRQRYYGIAIPRGEGRYDLNKNTGEVTQVNGPQIFLPDPRVEIVVRRVLDDRTVQLWYPGNEEALAFNRHLRTLAPEGEDYISDAVVRSAHLNRAAVRSAGSEAYLASYAGGRFEGAELQRRTTFSPPPTLTLNTKYDGVPSITIWTGYAIQVVNKIGQRRVVVGPDTTLLQYDESLEVLELSTGKPKTTDSLHRDVYLRIDHNLVSDIVQIETKDLVPVDLKVSYRVNFLREHQDKWFNVENYVKYLCDHLRSVLKNFAKKSSIKEWTEDSTSLVRNAVLGEKKEGERRSKFFPENGMEVYDVEVLKVSIVDESIRILITKAQRDAVQGAIQLGTAEQKLELTRKQVTVTRETLTLENELAVEREALTRSENAARAETALNLVTLLATEEAARLKAQVDQQAQLTTVSEAELARTKAISDLTLAELESQTAMFAKRMAAITPNLIEAMNTMGRTEFAIQLSTALAPLALTEQQGLGQTIERVFAGTLLEPFVANLKTKKANGGAELVP